jgi:hypothetical protein
MAVNIYDMADTWNAIGTTFDAIKMNVSNGAGGAPVYAAGSKVIHLQRNSSTIFAIDAFGELAFGSTSAAGLRLNNLTEAQRDALASPVEGQMIWNTDSGAANAYDGATWGEIGGGGGLDVGTTAVTNGTATRIFYHAAGDVLGEYTLTGTGTVVAMQTAPTFVTSITTPRAVITQGTLTDPATNIDATVTWNDAADTFTAWKLNVTSTASAAASLLMDLQVGGSSKITVRKDGYTQVYGPAWLHGSSDGGLGVEVNGSNEVIIGHQDFFSWASAGSFASPDVKLYRDAANTLALRNSTNAQTFRVYNTESSSLTNYERGSLVWATNIFRVQTEAGGTGTQREMYLNGAGVRILDAGTTVAVFTASNINIRSDMLFNTDNTDDIGASGATRPRTGYFGTSVVTPIATITQGTITADAPQINGTVTWNNAGVAFTGWKFRATVTAADSTSKLIDIGTTASGFAVSRFGVAGTIAIQQHNSAADTFSAPNVKIYDSIVNIRSTGAIKWWTGSPAAGEVGTAADTMLYRDAAAILALRNSTNAQTFRVYATADGSPGSNFQRLVLSSGATSNMAIVAADNGGTGVAMGLQFGVALTTGGGVTNIANFTTSGHLIWNTDNTYDIGASGATRPRNLFLGGGIAIGSSANYQFTSRGFFSASSDGVFIIRNNAASDFGRLQFGGSTSSFPALKRSTTYLQMRLADDSDYADFACRASVTPRTSELTIATGAVTATGSYHSVDTEADAASDDLDTINGGVGGMRLVLRASDSGRTVVVKDGTGNIQCAGDMSLDNIQDTIELIYDDVQTAWLEVGRSDNGA